MHTLHGNGHPETKCNSITCGTLNIAGFNDSKKWLAVKQLDIDVLALTETHLQTHVQHAFHHKFPNHFFLPSIGKPDKNHTGLAFLIRKNICWSYKVLTWEKDHPCHSFVMDNRLSGLQIWTGDGSTCVFLYAVYLPSGARWESDKRDYAHRLLKAVEQDLRERGDVISLMMGDLNLTTAESAMLTKWSKQGPWFNRYVTSPPGERDKPTCHQGKGSRIDFIMASLSAFDLIHSYQVHHVPCCSNHSLVQVQIQLPKACQIRRTQRSVSVLPPIKPPGINDLILPDTLTHKFQEVVAQKDSNLGPNMQKTFFLNSPRNKDTQTKCPIFAEVKLNFKM